MAQLPQCVGTSSTEIITTAGLRPCPAFQAALAVGVTVNKLFIFFFMGLLVGSAFAEEQLNPVSEISSHADPKTPPESKDERQAPSDNNTAKNKETSPDTTNIAESLNKATSVHPKDQENNKAKYININVPDTADSASAWISEVLVYRGEWVQSGAVVAILKDWEKEIYVKSPSAGVIMKVHVARGDSVSQGAALIQLKQVDIQRPSFRLAWNLFSLMNVNVPSVGKRIGGKVQENIDIPEKEKGKWTNACTIRMSFVLNNTGFPVKQGKYSTVSGKKGGLYIHRIDEISSYLRDIFGDPDIVVDHPPSPNDFNWMKGILLVTGNGNSDARGHVTLWNGIKCSDTCHLAGDEDNVNFTPLKAALWVLP
ncbi:MAG: hypothetical protein LBP99_09560 [Azoarcus sp.]|jgi:biotin carboxyl carrier protein|nr:hypothetical protein [Azoarcus sp.]